MSGLRPSLRRRLLVFLLIPMAALLVLDAGLTYGVALSYANRVHDRDLSDDALTLAKMMGNQQLGSQLTPQARFLLEYDPDGHSYFSVRSSQRGLLAGNPQLPQPTHAPPLGAAPMLFDTQRDRRQQAREILLLATVMQTLLLICVLSLVWFGVNHGLRVLDPLTARLAARSHELTPIGRDDVRAARWVSRWMCASASATVSGRGSASARSTCRLSPASGVRS